MASSHIRAFLVIFSCTLSFLEVSACAGCVQLTEFTFDKIISKFDVNLVKFDVAFPYGEKHEAYAELAKDAKSIDELLIAEVGIKDYGERDNEEIAKRFGIKKDDYPVVKMFVKGNKEPITYPDSKEFTTDNLRRFVKEKSGIHLSLPGCLAQFDKIAFKFMKAKGNERKKQLKSAETAAAGLDEKKKSTAKIYQQIMQKVIDKGEDFIASENERVKKLLDSKLSPEKKKELNSKLNILLSFSEIVVGDSNTKKTEF